MALPGVTSIPASQHPRSVLVVDDSGVCRARLKAMCNRLYPGVVIAQAVDGDAAVVDFERQLRAGSPYDVVLMDLNMVGDDDRPQLSGMLDERNGPQASVRIRRAELAVAHDTHSAKQSRAIVIVITGSTRCASRARARNVHGRAFAHPCVSPAAFRASPRTTASRARATRRAERTGGTSPTTTAAASTAFCPSP